MKKKNNGSSGPKCRLCGKAKKLTRTECCKQWICDDEANYVMFSYAGSSCSRNHNRYTLCGHHNAEQHEGKWQECKECQSEFETEMYVYYGTNEYNFEKLANPPSFDPTLCGKCKKRINLGSESYTISGKKYICSKCFSIKLP